MPAVRIFRISFPAALTAALALAALSCAAAPMAVPVGDTRIALDAPPGFSDTTSMASPRLQDLAEALTAASNRILLFALSDDDVRRFTQGDTPTLRRYMVVVTPKGLEQQRVTPELFGTFVADSVRELGPAAPEGVEYHKYLESRSESAPVLLAELRREPQTVSILQGARLPPPPHGLFEREKPPTYVLSTTTLLLVRGKALNLGVYTAYDSAADLDWIRVNTARWVDELQRLNNR
jgi:hypothetical protein